MKIDVNKINLKEVSENIFTITHDNSTLKFWTPEILVPFGINNEYGKYLIKLEIDEDKEEHIHLKKLILHIENLIKKKLNLEEHHEFKSVVKKRDKKSDIIECKLKMMKDNIITNIEYRNEDKNYLKTIYDLQKQTYIKAQIEINALWDYRSTTKKCGLLVYITKIIVP